MLGRRPASFAWRRNEVRVGQQRIVIAGVRLMRIRGRRQRGGGRGKILHDVLLALDQVLQLDHRIRGDLGRRRELLLVLERTLDRVGIDSCGALVAHHLDERLGRRHQLAQRLPLQRVRRQQRRLADLIHRRVHGRLGLRDMVHDRRRITLRGHHLEEPVRAARDLVLRRARLARGADDQRIGRRQLIGRDDPRALGNNQLLRNQPRQLGKAIGIAVAAEVGFVDVLAKGPHLDKLHLARNRERLFMPRDALEIIADHVVRLRLELIEQHRLVELRRPALREKLGIERQGRVRRAVERCVQRKRGEAIVRIRLAGHHHLLDRRGARFRLGRHDVEPGERRRLGRLRLFRQRGRQLDRSAAKGAQPRRQHAVEQEQRNQARRRQAEQVAAAPRGLPGEIRRRLLALCVRQRLGRLTQLGGSLQPVLGGGQPFVAQPARAQRRFPPGLPGPPRREEQPHQSKREQRRPRMRGRGRRPVPLQRQPRQPDDIKHALAEREAGQHHRGRGREHLSGQSPAFQQNFLVDGMHGGRGGVEG